MNIFFDLDGTLLDISKRYYAIHLEAAKIINHPPLSFKKYWQLKGKKVTEDKMLNLDPKTEKFVLYEKERAKLLEEKKFLRLDRPFPWVYKLLSRLSKAHNLYIVTVRRNKKNLILQLKKLKLLNFFVSVLTAIPLQDSISTKSRLIKRINPKPNDILIGDTETDIIVAQNLGIKSVAVFNGIRSKALLKAYKPDFLVKEVPLFFENKFK